MYILSLRPWRFISGPRRESISGLITLIMIRGTNARTVTDIPTGKQLPIIAFQISSLSLMRHAVGIMEGWSVAKYQIPIPNDQNSFGILKLGPRPQGVESKRSADNFGHCDLFDICDLLFGIFWSVG